MKEMNKMNTDSYAPSPSLSQSHLSGGLTVVGEVIKIVSPDSVELRVGAETQAVNATQALKDNSKMILQIVNALRKQGISEKDISNGGLVVHPLFQTSGSSPPAQGKEAVPRIIGYDVRSTLRLTLNDRNRAADVLDSAIRAGGNFGVALWLTMGKEATIRRAVLADAAEEARAKAQNLAASVDRKLGEAIALVEDIFFPFRGPGIHFSSSSFQSQQSSGSYNGTILPSGVPGSDLFDIQIGARVQVTYAFR